LIVEIFASSILGGLTSIFGALLGGLVIGGSEDLVTIGIAQGFGFVGTGLVALLFVIVGVFLIRKNRKRKRIFPFALAILGIYILVEMASGFSSDLFVLGLVEGFGANVTPFQKAIPLVIMVVTLLILPKGLVSINLKRWRK